MLRLKLDADLEKRRLAMMAIVGIRKSNRNDKTFEDQIRELRRSSRLEPSGAAMLMRRESDTLEQVFSE